MTQTDRLATLKKYDANLRWFVENLPRLRATAGVHGKFIAIASRKVIASHADLDALLAILDSEHAQEAAAAVVEFVRKQPVTMLL